MSRDDFYASPLGASLQRLHGAAAPQPHDRQARSGAATPGAYYESMAAVGEVPTGGRSSTAPAAPDRRCGPWRPTRGVRYVAADLSPAMLRPARGSAPASAVSSDLEFVRAEAEDRSRSRTTRRPLPLLLGPALLPRPGRRDRRGRRVLKPGGRLVGASFVRGPSLRQRLTLRPHGATSGRCAPKQRRSAGSPAPASDSHDRAARASTCSSRRPWARSRRRRVLSSTPMRRVNSPGRIAATRRRRGRGR